MIKSLNKYIPKTNKHIKNKRNINNSSKKLHNIYTQTKKDISSNIPQTTCKLNKIQKLRRNNKNYKNTQNNYWNIQNT